MSCSNCFNGCPEIISDQCVRYTGIDIPLLGIKNGDSLSYVEQALIQFLTSTLDGTGIIIDIPQASYCAIVTNNLPTCGEITATVLFEALIKSICQINTLATATAATVSQINTGYTGSTCMPSITLTTPVNQVIQTVINTLCQLSDDFDAFVIDVETNYVLLADLNNLIQAYLDSQSTSTKYYNRMVPYTVVEYYGSLVNFDITGAGIGDWEKIYLCNGMNGTPDKRGVVGVGAIVGVPSTVPLNTRVDPAVNPTFNPNYSLGGPVVGTNSITLSTAQIPTHSHTATISPNPHTHTFDYSVGTQFAGSSTNTAVQGIGSGGSTATPDSVTLSATISSTGGNQAHANNQPALACYYIMYIP